MRQSGNARWKPLAPLLFARLTHYYGTDAKLRVFRYERWIPGKWVELHRTYLRAAELGLDRVPATLASGGQIDDAVDDRAGIHLRPADSPAQHRQHVAAAARLGHAQLRAWSRRLQIDAVPRSLEGFFVDVAGRSGLGRRTGNDSGSMLRYLDTTPLTEQLDRAIAALRQVEATDQGPAAQINQQRIGILEKVAPALAPNLNAEMRRDRRTECAITATVRIGLSRICQELNQKDNGIVAGRSRQPARADRSIRGRRRHAPAAARPVTSTIRWR